MRLYQRLAEDHQIVEIGDRERIDARKTLANVTECSRQTTRYLKVVVCIGLNGILVYAGCSAVQCDSQVGPGANFERSSRDQARRDAFAVNIQEWQRVRIESDDHVVFFGRGRAEIDESRMILGRTLNVDPSDDRKVAAEVNTGGCLSVAAVEKNGTVGRSVAIGDVREPVGIGHVRSGEGVFQIAVEVPHVGQAVRGDECAVRIACGGHVVHHVCHLDRRQTDVEDHQVVETDIVILNVKN